MKAFPFQSNFVKMDEHNSPIYDRAIGADFFRAFWNLFFKNGIFANPSTNFQVTAYSGLTVRVAKGACFIQGVTGIEDTHTDLTLDKADDTRTRTDLIVLRVDLSQNRRLTVEVKKDTESLRRDSDVWELQLAKVTVPPRASSIRQQDILDTRMDKNVCGVVTSTVDQVDVTTIFNQYKDYWDRKRLENENAWKKQMQSQQSTFEKGYKEKMNTIDKWYQGVLANLEALKTFDFDNISELKGAKKTTKFLPSGSIEETIIMSANGQKVADRVTRFIRDLIFVTQKLYKDDQVIKQSKSIISFDGAKIEEVIK